MPYELTEEEIYKEARARVKKRREFLSHLVAYVLINVILVVIWALSGRGYMWFLWPLGIWGIFVLWSFIDAFLLYKSVQSEKAAVEHEVEKMKGQGYDK